MQQPTIRERHDVKQRLTRGVGGAARGGTSKRGDGGGVLLPSERANRRPEERQSDFLSMVFLQPPERILREKWHLSTTLRKIEYFYVVLAHGAATRGNS